MYFIKYQNAWRAWPLKFRPASPSWNHYRMKPCHNRHRNERWYPVGHGIVFRLAILFTWHNLATSDTFPSWSRYFISNMSCIISGSGNASSALYSIIVVGGSGTHCLLFSRECRHNVFLSPASVDRQYINRYMTRLEGLYELNSKCLFW